MTAMIPEKVRQVLDRHGLTPLEFEAGSTPTSEAAAARIGVQVGQIAKSILLCGKDKRFRLAVMPGDRKISSAKFKRITGLKHRMADAEETLERTGFRVGGVCPFGLQGIDIYIDEGLKEYDLVYPAAGNDASGVPIRFDQLVEITKGQVCSIAQDAVRCEDSSPPAQKSQTPHFKFQTITNTHTTKPSNRKTRTAD